MAKKEEEKTVKIEKSTLWLPVKLLEDEHVDRSKELARLVTERFATEREKSIANRDFGEKLKNVAGEISRLTTIVAEGYERRQVNCHREYDYDANKVRLIRLDTREILEERDLRTDEKQLPLKEQSGVDATF